MSDEPRMTGMDKEIFNATRTLTSLLNNACNHWNYLCPYLEKLARVADDALRGYQKDYPEQVAELIDLRRKSERKPVGNTDTLGNAAAMRDALVNLTRFTEVDIRGLENLAKYAMDHSMYGGGVLRAVAGAIRESKKSLAEPPRNCDVGTAKEQTKRFSDFCAAHRHTDLPMCAGCALENTPSNTGCSFAWAQMPYEAEEGAEHGEA